MINPANVVKIFADRASNLSSTVSNSATSAITVTHREYGAANLLCSVLKSIDEVECEDATEKALDPNWNDENEEKALCKRFSLDCMTKAVEFCDEIKIYKLEKERDEGRPRSTSSDVSHIKSISRAFAVILKNVALRNTSLTKLMIMCSICSSGLDRKLCQCMILIYDDGL
ncbi:unnamed protein product [Adineta ricciae]|uniref:Uncharacterized protein n=1 Tax=Adineta ricciae TaxID=249248 RepID=A0A815NZE8_ADIRI|nr:unnamed protein product [Adineta ricciae]CAF1554040.1 unnamed protein product [Adineta ricciae]